MTQRDEIAKNTPPLHELLGVPASQAEIFEPAKLLELLFKDDGKAQLIQALNTSTNKSWNQDMILELLSGKNKSLDTKVLPVAPKKESSQSKEQIVLAISKSKLVWLKALQTIDLMATDQGGGLSCIGLSAYKTVPGFTYVGERDIASYAAGMLGSGKDNFARDCLDPNSQGNRKDSFVNIRTEIDQTGLAARVSDTEYFLMGRFSSEKRFISPDKKSGRNRENNYIRIKFETSEELHSFLDLLEVGNPNASELLSYLVEASIRGVGSLPSRGDHKLDTEYLLEVVGQVGLDVKLPKPVPFTEKQIQDIESLRLDRVEDVR